jgi:hypothetical protein
MAVKMPPGLGEGGRKLWREVTAAHELRADDRRILADACNEADLIDSLQAAMADAPQTVKGSMGQTVIHPLISELRQHRATLNTLLRGLSLAGSDTRADDAARTAREGAMALARARWDRGRSA